MLYVTTIEIIIAYHMAQKFDEYKFDVFDGFQLDSQTYQNF